ncbi:hypothetical protein [Sphingomonas sp. 28-63-12]|uniref:hypothetical protein n=1 Tax=Sphingomonas sp. 28-63-12 TaxID=1970434 RepID=UPI0035A97C7E
MLDLPIMATARSAAALATAVTCIFLAGCSEGSSDIIVRNSAAKDLLVRYADAGEQRLRSVRVPPRSDVALYPLTSLKNMRHLVFIDEAGITYSFRNGWPQREEANACRACRVIDWRGFGHVFVSENN